MSKVMTRSDLLGSRRKLELPELLAPAGNLEKLKFAIRYGADAVYIGGQSYGLRSNADNFSFEQMREGVASPNSTEPKCSSRRIFMLTMKICRDSETI